MSHDHHSTWERYVSAWRATSSDEIRALADECLTPACTYTDPHTECRGVDELVAYMKAFHEQVPGGHFVTHHFESHHNKSIARWNMVDGGGNILGDGISYGEYDDNNRLVAMTGFFATP